MLRVITDVRPHFNCTIQELKQKGNKKLLISATYFNCTIQELKHVVERQYKKLDYGFQLHHTGIKTRV